MQCAISLAGPSVPSAKNIRRCLLGKGDAYLTKHMDLLRAIRDRDLDVKDPDAKWRKELVDLCRTSGISYHNLDVPVEMKDAPGIQSLLPREHCGLAFWLRKDPTITAIDLKPSIGRMNRMHDDILNTVLPDSRVFVVSERRLLVGLECMAVQGFPIPMLKKFAAEQDGSQDRLFSDMAGNAFSAPVVTSVLIGCLANLTATHLQNFGRGVSTRSEPSDDDDGDVVAFIGGLAS